MKNGKGTGNAGQAVISEPKWRGWLRQYLSAPAVLWIMLWFSINTGPWVIRSEPENLIDWLHWLRALCPPLVLFLSTVLLVSRRDSIRLPGNVRQWFIYGVIGLIACLFSPDPVDAAYWAAAYLAAFAVIKTYMEGRNLHDEILHLNILSLIIVTGFLLALIFFSFDALYVETRGGVSGYGIEGRMPMIAQMPMSRSSGMARFAAVPGVLSFVFLWFGSSWKRFLWAIPLLFSAWIIYSMQSRGAVIGFCFVLAFEMLFLGGRKRVAALVLMIFFGLLLMSSSIPGEFFEEASDYLKRGQSTEELQSMTGRTYTWERGWRQIMEAPVIGRGFQADRFLLAEHIHNTYLYALLTAGFTGAAAYVSGLLWSWILFLRAIRTKFEGDRKHSIFLIQAGGILAFFTVRGIS